MTTRCDDCRPRLLELQYGLLDPAEVAVVENHLRDCPDCTAARGEAGRWNRLLARAARGIGPDVTFTPPAEPTYRADFPVVPRSESPRRPVSDTTAYWVMAGTVLIALAGVGWPAANDLSGFLAARSAARAASAKVEAARAERERAQADLESARADAENRYRDALRSHDELVAAWVKAEQTARETAERRLYSVDVRGPARALPGAPNDYAFWVVNKSGRPQRHRFEAVIKDGAGHVVHTHTFPAADPPRGEVVRLSPQVWADAEPGADLYLHVHAVDPDTGERTDLTDAIHLSPPVYATYLTTDKPAYRPGDTVFFRSLTLDRSRLLPPAKDQTLRFELRGPNNRPVPGCELVGLAKPVEVGEDGRPEPVKGPDGRPVRGVGSGAFHLPADLPPGEYNLRTFELPPGGATPSERTGAGPKPNATRRIRVHNDNPDRFAISLEFDAERYLPGDPLRLKLTAAENDRPLAGAAVRVRVTANGRPLPFTGAMVRTGPDGTATVRFRVPFDEDLAELRFSVTVLADGASETISRTAPVATPRPRLEFFPEGGDLIAGVPNRVYFRAFTWSGRPTEFAGVLSDGDRTICPVLTVSDPDRPGSSQGLGSFTFTPEAGRRYVVRSATQVEPRLTRPGSAALAGVAATLAPRGYTLPVAKPDGVAITASNAVSGPGEPIRLRVWSTGKDRLLLIGAYVRGLPVAHTRVSVEAGKPSEVILDPGAAKIGGVTRVTVFVEPTEAGGTHVPVAERLVFRRPGDGLKIGFAPRNADGTGPDGPFTPGSPIRLDISAADENENPTPAILWAAVVNQSALALADDRTDRLLPTHFLLATEVRGPDDLEDADFLLTDRPGAAEALDLLLGTQGWRRFAEQGPEQFRKRTPAEDAERLLVAAATRGPVPGAWRDDIRRVFDEYWPRYEVAVSALDDADDARVRLGVARPSGPLGDGLTQADQAANAAAEALRLAVAPMAAHVPTRSASSRFSLSLAALTVASGLALLIGFTRPSSSAARRSGLIAAAALGLLGAFVGLAGVGSDFEFARWQTLAATPPAADGLREPPPLPPAPATEAPPLPTPMRTPEDLASPTAAARALAFAEEEPRGGFPANSARLGQFWQRGNAPMFAQARPRGPSGPPTAAWAVSVAPPQPRRWPIAELSDAAKKLSAPDFSDRVNKWADDSLHRTPPLVVRQYAHFRPAAPAEGQPDEVAETVLWQPVIVLPGSGRASVRFTLGGAEHPYEVLVAGHTLDGRIGAVTGRIEVRPAPATGPAAKPTPAVQPLAVPDSP